MRILWISDAAPPKGAEGRSFRATPSLSALAIQSIECKTFDAAVLDCRNTCPYSVPHILSAADLFRVASIRLCVLGGSMRLNTNDWLLHCEGAPELALEGLQKLEIAKKPSKRSEKSRSVQMSPAIPTLPHPPGALVMIDVVGSQARIGCTTQCLQLFHYFSALGFQPAIITTPMQASVLQRLMGGNQVGDTRSIDGVAFVTSVQSRYDCYIRDVGCIDESNAAAAQNADICVLAAGIKPWEISSTVAALTLLQGVSRLLTVVSFGGDDSEQQMQALLQKAGHFCPAINAPWQPNPFTPTAIHCYEALRPILETMMKEEELCE